jgi:hypothetical protein
MKQKLLSLPIVKIVSHMKRTVSLIASAKMPRLHETDKEVKTCRTIKLFFYGKL